MKERKRKEMVFYLGDKGFSYFKHINLSDLYVCFHKQRGNLIRRRKKKKKKEKL
jgi:hypothetical protein